MRGSGMSTSDGRAKFYLISLSSAAHHYLIRCRTMRPGLSSCFELYIPLLCPPCIPSSQPPLRAPPRPSFPAPPTACTFPAVAAAMSPSFDEKNASSDRESVPEDGVRKFDPRIAEELQAEEDAHVGVKAVEAAEKVYGKYSKWFLFIGCVSGSLHLNPRPPRSLYPSDACCRCSESRSRATSIPLMARRRTITSLTLPPTLTSTPSFPQSRSPSPLSVRASYATSLYTPVDLVYAHIVACGKPVIAKFADVRSRSQAYIVVRE